MEISESLDSYFVHISCELRDYAKAENPPEDCHIIALALRMAYLQGYSEGVISRTVPALL